MAFDKAVTQKEKARGWHFHRLGFPSGVSDGGKTRVILEGIADVHCLGTRDYMRMCVSTVPRHKYFP